VLVPRAELVHLLEHVFASATFWANPVVWQVFKSSPWLDSVVRIAFIRVIDVTTNETLPLGHFALLFLE